MYTGLHNFKNYYKLETTKKTDIEECQRWDQVIEDIKWMNVVGREERQGIGIYERG